MEKLLSGDFRRHNVLRLPYQQPFYTALGCAVLGMLAVLFFAGGDDVIAVATSGSVAEIRTLLRILFFVVPVVAGAITYAVCIRMRRRRADADAATNVANDVVAEIEEVASSQSR
jgi:ubiquinol-cytochrome c reductase cytochrome b subunit